MRIATILLALTMTTAVSAQQNWPDGTPIDAWFTDTMRIDPQTLGKQYVITDHGVRNDSTLVQTEAIQAVIDKAAREGGGVVTVPEGTFLTGALFFRQGTHLHLLANGRLKGSDAIKHFPVVKTRMEGQTLNYFAALINADGLNGFTITGPGTIDGNGLRYWEEFWIRRQYNPQCTNLEAMRPRLGYISNCENVQVQDVRLINSPFWTNHLYRSHHVKYVGCYIFAPTSGVKAPSSDAIDIDYCHDILVSHCYMSVNDDAVVLKGGKGTFADLNPDNGENYNVMIDECHYGRVHGCLTLGSESLHDWNVVFRNSTFDNASRVLWLKMRPDTPQHYEQVTVENVSGYCGSFLVVRPWTQFYKREERDDMPLSQCNDIVIKGAKVECKNFFDVGASDKYALRNFYFSDCDITDEKQAFNPTIIEGCHANGLVINGQAIKTDCAQ